MTKERIENIIRMTIEEAKKTARKGNAPFAAIACDKKGNIIAKASNSVYTQKDPTAHAEINLLRKLARIESIKPKDCLIFINAEPCSMCSSAMIRRGIKNIYYGADQEDTQILKIPLSEIARKSKEKIKITKGILKSECEKQIKEARKNKYRE